MTILPLWQKVLVDVDRVGETTNSGLLTKHPDTVEREQMTEIKGTLAAIGDGSFSVWAGHKPRVGDRVIFAKFAGHYLTEDDRIQRLMNDDDIVAIIE